MAKKKIMKRLDVKSVKEVTDYQALKGLPCGLATFIITYLVICGISLMVFGALCILGGELSCTTNGGCQYNYVLAFVIFPGLIGLLVGGVNWAVESETTKLVITTKDNKKWRLRREH